MRGERRARAPLPLSAKRAQAAARTLSRVSPDCSHFEVKKFSTDADGKLGQGEVKGLERRRTADVGQAPADTNLPTAVEHFEKLAHVFEMEPRGGLVEDVKGAPGRPL